MNFLQNLFDGRIGHFWFNKPHPDALYFMTEPFIGILVAELTLYYVFKSFDRLVDLDLKFVVEGGLVLRIDM